jgi:CubicO group peptidase (beta-lactamase class C family)
VTHTSGLRDADIFGSPGSGDLYSYGDTSITLAEFMEGYFVPGGQWYNSVANFRNRMPGNTYEYSNFAAALAGYLVETITGTKLRDHSVGNLFGPLGMTNTGWHLADFSDVSLIAMPYYGNNTEIGHYSYPDYPDGQLRSSPADLGTYMAVMLGGGETSGVRVLEPESVDLAFDDVFNNYAGQGVFWYRYDGWAERNACHSGGDYGVLSDMCLLLESQVGVAVVVNHDSFAAEDALYEVFDLLVAKGLELPTAEFSTAQTSGNAPFDAEFTDLSTDGPTSWLWTFGDGGSSTLQDPNYQYTTEGDYTVTLTSTNGAGSDSETKVDHIHISVPEPALLTQLLSGVFGLFALNASRKRG